MRFINKDIVTALNFGLILKSLRETGARSMLFKWPKKRSSSDDSMISANKKKDKFNPF